MRLSSADLGHLMLFTVNIILKQLGPRELKLRQPTRQPKIGEKKRDGQVVRAEEPDLLQWEAV